MFIHYQEQAIFPDGPHLLIDQLMPLSDYIGCFGDEYHLEHLLNTMDKWHDNGVTYILEKEYPLECRIRRIVCEDNAYDYSMKNKIQTVCFNGIHPVGTT